MNKNLWLLILSQIFAFTAAPVTVFLSGIIGSQFSPVKSLATLPMSLSIVGVATPTIDKDIGNVAKDFTGLN